MPKPTITLCVMARDEAAIIRRALESVREHIDSWVLCDTGSTDDTKQIAADTMAGIPGAILDHEWRDFSHNRNLALQAANAVGRDWTFVLDADQTFHGDFSQISDAIDAYGIEQRMGGERWPLTKLTKSTLAAEYSGGTHEGFNLPPGARFAILPGCYVQEHGDSSRRTSGRKNSEDEALLRAELAADPNSVHALYYLAQTLRDTGRLDESLALYDRCAASDSVYVEMRWSAAYRAAQIREWLGQDPADVIRAYQAASALYPVRAESHCDLAAYARKQGRHELAHDVARAAASLPVPPFGLFVDASAYRWRAADELSLACNALGRVDEAAEITAAAIRSADTPDDFRAHLAENLSHYLTVASPHAVSRRGKVWHGPPPVVVSSAHDVRIEWAVACMSTVAYQSVFARHVYTVNDDCACADEIEQASKWMPYAEITRITGADLFLAHLAAAVRDLPPDTVVICLDGDDFLLTDTAIERVMSEHAGGALATYGQFEPIPALGWGSWRASPYPRDVVLAGSYRADQWRATHLKTFRAGLFQRIRPADLRGPGGQWIRHCWDQAVMLPVLEMAAERAVFIADPIYGYRINNPASDHNHDAETREPRERELAHVRALPRYERIEWPEPARCYPWEDPDPKTEAVVL